MTKDEARDAAWAWMDSRVDGTLGSNHDYFDNGFDAGYDFAKSEDRWIPVSERLPDKDGLYVITTTSPTTTREAWWNSRKEIWTTFDGGNGFDAVAWRPLPEPYKEKI